MPHDFTFNTVPILPLWAIGLLALVLLALLIHGSLLLARKKVPAKWVTILAALRLVIIAVFVLCLLQPVASFSRSVERLPDLLVMVDTSQSMGLRSAAGGDKTRLRESIDKLRAGGVLGDLESRYRLRWFAFDRNAYPVERADLEGLQPTGETTRFAESLATAFEYQRQSDPAAVAPARALLISDGNDLGAEDVVETSRRLALPVDTLAPAAPPANAAAEKITIASAQSPRRVLLGSNAQLTVTLRADGDIRRPVPITLSQGDTVLTTQELTFDSGKPEQQVRLAFKPAEIGLQEYELRVGDPASDASDASPSYKLSVQVVGDKNEVLVLEDTWRWSFKFLRRVLEDDPSFTMTAFLPRGSAYMQFGEPERRINLGAFPQTRAELEWFDVIVLGDINPKRWPRGLARAIEQIVTEQGKSLIVVGGPNLGQLADTPELAALLPVEITPQVARPIEGPIPVRVTSEGATSSFFSLSSLGDTSSLPALDYIYPPLRKKPAASILLEAANKSNAYGPLIVVAEHTVGRGRVLFLGTDTAWKWQMQGPQDEAGVTAHALFWQQALRAMAPTRPAGGGVNLSVQPRRTRYEAGRRVTLDAAVQTERPLNQPTLTSIVTMPGGRQVPLAFTASSSEAGAYQAEFEASEPGQYRVAAALNAEGKAVAEVITAIDVEPPRAESSSTGVDAGNLARIAAATGGKAIDPANRDTWPAAVQEAGSEVEVARSIDLWNNFSLVLILCALLGADWLLRLLRGYV